MSIPVPPCIGCSQLDRTSTREPAWRCNAFPSGIPAEILSGRNQHEEPFPGDRGIRADPLPAYRWRYEHPARAADHPERGERTGTRGLSRNSAAAAAP